MPLCNDDIRNWGTLTTSTTTSSSTSTFPWEPFMPPDNNSDSMLTMLKEEEDSWLLEEAEGGCENHPPDHIIAAAMARNRKSRQRHRICHPAEKGSGSSSPTSSSPASSSSSSTRLFRKSAESSDDSGINRDELTVNDLLHHQGIEDDEEESSEIGSRSRRTSVITPPGPGVLIGPPHHPLLVSPKTSRENQDDGSGLLLSSDSEEGSTTLPTNYNETGKSSEEKLLDLTILSGYNMVQRNGQRIFGGPPPGWVGPPPGKGSEIFVGKVPRDCYEDELVPIFEKVGRIYELRLMMDFSGSNRGYFFVRYTCREDARRATRDLNNYEIRPRKFLGVIWSVDNRKLWISGIPKDRSPAEIKAGMEQLTDGVRDVILYPSKNDKSKNRGYAFVEYESHRAAALARRKLVPGNVFLLDHEIEKVDWAEPENEPDDDIISKVRILFVRNLMASTTEEDIQQVFDRFTDGSVERVKKTMNYAFVHFTTREAAEEAMDKARGLILDDAEVEVSWSRPVDKDAHKTRKVLSKALTSPNGIVSLDQSLSSVMGGQPMATIRGAPGTAPPAALLRKLVGSGGGGVVNQSGGHGMGTEEGGLFDHRHYPRNNPYLQQQFLQHGQVIPYGVGGGLLQPPPFPGGASAAATSVGAMMGGANPGDCSQHRGGGSLHHHSINMDMIQQAFSGMRMMEPLQPPPPFAGVNNGGGGLDSHHGGFLGIHPAAVSAGGFYKGLGLVDQTSKYVSYIGNGGGGLDPSVFQNGLMMPGGGFVSPQVFHHLGGSSGFCHHGNEGNNNHHHHAKCNNHHHHQGMAPRCHQPRPFHGSTD